MQKTDVLVPSCTHPDPIRGQKCLERSNSEFSDFLLSPFHLFRPALLDFAPSVLFVAKLTAKLRLNPD